MKYKSNLPEWRKDVIKFLSSHKKHRMFGWEFGPTLLDHLHRVKEGQSSDYTKRGLLLTYSIASVALFISFASTRRAAFTAAVTSGVILLGVVTTIAIDYQKIKRKDSSEVESQEYCILLLKALGNTPRYWWWPWGKRIKDVEITEKEIERARDYSNYPLVSRLFYSLFTNVALHQLCIAKYGYFCNYQELTEESILIPQSIKKRYEEFRSKLKSAASSYIAYEEVADKLKTRSNNLIRKIFNVGDESTVTLKKALDSFKKEWLLLYLDKSLEGVRAGTKTIEDHNKYFNEQVREILKLSLVHHPDKQEQNVDTKNEQILINNVTQALRNIHDYVIESREMLEQRVAYRLFEDAPIKNIINLDALAAASIVAKSGLSSIAFWEGEILMRGRNEYLSSARSCLEVLSGLPESRDDVSSVRSKFDEIYNTYKDLYQEKWIKSLEELSKECIELKELEIVKGDIDILLKESKEQHEILEKGLMEGKADEMFIQPILEYYILMNIYFIFFNVAGEKDMRECCKERDSISEEEKQEIEKLSHQELLKSAKDTCSELASKLIKKGKLVNQQEGSESRKKELGKVLLKLECVTKLLENKFKVKETLMEREGKRMKEEKQKLKELREEIEQNIQLRQEAVQARQEAVQARQETELGRQAAEQKAAKLEEMLRRMGVDPDTVLDDVNLSQGASAGVGRN